MARLWRAYTTNISSQCNHTAMLWRNSSQEDDVKQAFLLWGLENLEGALIFF